MKKLLVILIFIVISLKGICQPDTLFSEGGQVLEIGALIDGEKEGKWVSYHENNLVESKGLYKHNKKIGEWTWYYDNGTLCCKEKYKNDKYKKGDFWDKDGNPTSRSEITIKPEYPGGIESFRKMVSDNLRYPEEASKEGVKGNVFLEFDINKSGVLVNLHVVRSVHPSLDKEAIRVVSLSELWTPGSLCEKPVTVGYVFPVVFVLQ